MTPFPTRRRPWCPVGPGRLDRMDDGLRLGCRGTAADTPAGAQTALRILDAGCGAGLTTLTLVRLNPGSTVIGLDGSTPSLDLARQRLAVAGGLDVSFFYYTSWKLRCQGAPGGLTSSSAVGSRGKWTIKEPS